MTTRSRLAGVVLAAGWVLVSLLPWWQLRVAFSDQSGTRTRIFSADVWRASTPATLAVIVAATVSIILVATRGHSLRTRTGLVIACSPVFLLGWAAWSIIRLTTAPKEYRITTTLVTDVRPFDGYHVVRDRLEIHTLPGYGEGPAWGLYVGVALVLVATVSAVVRLLKSPKPE